MMKGQNTLEATLGPLQRKTFGSALDLFFQEQVPQIGGNLSRAPVVREIEKLVDRFYPPRDRMRMGQVLWPAVAADEASGYGKRIEQTRLQPVFLDLIREEDVKSLLGGEKRKSVRQRIAVRLFKQAKEQSGVLTSVDVSTMLHLTPATISRYVRTWEKDHGELVPRRGTLHDMGPSITHKRAICYKVLVEGKGIGDVARETNHSPEAVTRYVNDYKRVHTGLRNGLDVDAVAYVTRMSKKLVKEYRDLEDKGW